MAYSRFTPKQVEKLGEELFQENIRGNWPLKT